MRPIARLRTELLVSGVGQALIGIAGLLVAFLGGASATRALVPFAGFAAALAVIQVVSGYRFVRQAAEAAVPAAAEVKVEVTTDTLRRGSVALTLPVAAVVLVAFVDVELTAWVAGVPFGVGLVDLASAGWVARWEERSGGALYRELGRSPFAGSRRPIYTLPRSAITSDT